MTRAFLLQLSVSLLVGVGLLAPVIAAPPPAVTIDELRAAIATDPNDPAIGARFTQLAETLLAQLAADAANTAVLFGLPTQEQLDRVAHAAQEAFDAANQASRALDNAIARLAADPSFADSQELQNLRSDLAVEYRLIRLPLVRARAAILVAATAPTDDDARKFARETLKSLDQLEDDSSLPISGAELVLRFAAASITGEPTSEQRHSAILALTEPGSLKSLQSQAPALARQTVVAAAFIRAKLGQTDRAHQLLTSLLRDDPANPLVGVVRRDALARLAIGAVAPARLSATNPRSAGRAMVELTRGAAMWPDALVRLAIEKAKRFAAPGLSAESLPAAALVAVGVAALDRNDLDAATAALKGAWSTLANQPSALSNLCGWSLAQSLRQQGALDNIVGAADVLLTLSNNEANAPSAAAALDSSVDLLQWALGATQRVGADDQHAAIASKLRIALRQALLDHPASPSVDRWRLALADLSAGSARRDLLEHIKPGGDAYPRAQLALAWIAYSQLNQAPSDAQREALAFTMLSRAKAANNASQSLDGGIESELTPTIAQAQAVALAWLRRFDQAADAATVWDSAHLGGAPDAVNLVRQRAAASLREALQIRNDQQAQAVAPALEKTSRLMLDRIERGDADRALAGSCAVDLADALQVQNRAADLVEMLQPIAAHVGMTRGVGAAMGVGLVAAGQNERAFAVLRDVVDASRALEITDDSYWRAWAGLIEILDSKNADGRRSDSILRQIARLRAEDQTLGGELTQRRLERIELRLQRTNQSH